MKWLVAVVALIFSTVAGSATGDEQIELNEMELGAGITYRASEQLEDIWKVLQPDYRRDGPMTAARLNSILRMGVWRLNGMRETLCSQRFMVEMTCVPPYVPKWAFESREESPSAKELDARTLELSSQVEPMFKEACARLMGKVSHEVYLGHCSLE
jgi:hypothetical protein